MSTVSSSPRPVKSKAKKERYVRVLGFLSNCSDHLVRIEERGQYDSTFSHYYVREIPADFGRGFRWEKFAIEGGDTYSVNIGDKDHPASCECLGHLHHGHRTVCKHVACTRKLIAEGKF